LVIRKYWVLKTSYLRGVTVRERWSKWEQPGYVGEKRRRWKRQRNDIV
jgi:hypothetical protein